MDNTDKLVNNKAPKRILLTFVILLLVTLFSAWFFSGKCADKIMSEQIKAMLSVAGDESNEEKFIKHPYPQLVEKGEEFYSKYSVSADMEPRFMDGWKNVRNMIFMFVFGISALALGASAFVSIKYIYKIYDDLECLQNDCVKIADQAQLSAKLYGGDFECVRRVCDGVNLIADRMNFLTGSLKSEKRFLKDFLTDFSHQLKTSLAVISLNNDMITQIDNLTDEKKSQLSCEITTHIESMEELVFSALKLAKLNSGSIDYTIVNDDLSQTCAVAVKKITPLLRTKNINISYENKKTIMVNHDKIWVCQAIENIIKNAIDHSECSEIALEIETNPTMTIVSITDNGKGIAQNDIPKIFKRFGTTSHSYNMSSVGIGMSIAKKIIQGNNGEILVYSEIGKYTRFEIVFIK